MWHGGGGWNMCVSCGGGALYACEASGGGGSGWLDVWLVVVVTLGGSKCFDSSSMF